LVTPYLMKSNFISTPKLFVSGSRTSTAGRTTAYGHRSNYLTTHDYESQQRAVTALDINQSGEYLVKDENGSHASGLNAARPLLSR